MKMNFDCIRDTLLYLEENLVLSDDLEFSTITLEQIHSSEDIKFPLPEIAHSLILLDEAGYIDAYVQYSDNRISYLEITRITYDGYQFLETIRPQTVWQKTKEVCKSIGSYSVNTIGTIATNILTQVISTSLNSIVI